MRILQDYTIREELIEDNIQLNREFLETQNRIIRTALLVMPDFVHVTNGGPNTIMRIAHYLADTGIKVTLAMIDATCHLDNDQFARDVRQAFGKHGNIEFLIANRHGEPFIPDRLPDSDICFATLWTTAYYLMKYKRTRAKFYLIQDYESLFYPAGWEYALAELTYEFGYIGIFNSPGLMEAVQMRHPIQGMSFTPGLDHEVYYPSNENMVAKSNDTMRIIFYGRPPVPRNMYELGKEALRLVKGKYGPRVQILIAGWKEEKNPINYPHDWLGYMPYEKTGDVYRTCQIGLAFMATPHPSYLPLQFMASGVVPVVARNPHTEWLLQNESNCIACYPTAHNIAEGISRIIEDKELRSKLRYNGIMATRSLIWDTAFKSIHEFLCSATLNELQLLE